MKCVLNNKKLKDSRGITLVEMLVTLSIFSLVSIVVTYSLMASLSSRNQIRVSQQLNDELRLVFDTMELEITSGSEFQTSDCTGGICKSIAFTVATRPDLTPYKVQYSFDDTTGKINKTIQRNDGVCDNLPLNPSCTFPVTSDDVNVTLANFDIVLSSGTEAQRPIVVVSIESESTTETGETIPLAYSSSYSPRVIQNVADIENNTDETPPRITFDKIEVSSASGACKGIFSDSAMNIPYDNDLNWGYDQTLPPAYTDCDFVKISYYAEDPETGIIGGRYDGTVDVEGGLCFYKACSNSNTSYYGLPVGVTNGSTEVYFAYDDIPLRPGIGDYSPPVAQKISLRAKNGVYSINPSSSYINIYHMGPPIPLNTGGMVARARLICYTGYPRTMLMVTPSSNNNVYQKFIHWYRCSPSDEFTNCDPISDAEADRKLQLHRFTSSHFGYKAIGASSYLSTYSYIFYNYLTATMPMQVQRETLYTYGFTVYDPFDESREESDLILLEWRPDFNTGLSSPNTLSSIGASDSYWRFADGRTFPTNPYIGSIPADYCVATGPADPDPTDPTPETSYTILPSVSGFWSATVTLVPGGTVYTNTVGITMLGTAPSVTVDIHNIDPAFAGVSLNPTNATLTQSSPTRLINLKIPSDMSLGSYSVELRVKGTDVPDEYVTVPLYVSLQSSGPT